MGGTSVDAPKVNLMATSLMTRSTIQDGGFEAAGARPSFDCVGRWLLRPW